MSSIHLLLVVSTPLAIAQDLQPRVEAVDLITRPAACASSIADQANSGDCIQASSDPTIGMLYPLSQNFYVDALGNLQAGADVLADGSVRSQGHVEAERFFGQVHAGFGSGSIPTYRFGDGSEVTGLASPSPDRISFITDGEQRMVIDRFGRVTIGTSLSNGADLWVWSDRDPTNGGDINNSALLVDAAGYDSEFLPSNAIRGRVGFLTGYGVYCSGPFAATGLKSFLQPHPTDSTKVVSFVCLEGNESGTYFRGSSRLVEGRCTIEVPEEFRLVSEPDALTVQLTPRGAPTVLWIESQDLQSIVVRGDEDVEFHYFVNAVRRGYKDVPLVRPNHDFVPEVRDTPFGGQYPDALRRVLVENGTLNPDFTPNEKTARENGWELRDPDPIRPPSVGTRR